VLYLDEKVSCSKSVLEVLEYDTNELIGENWFDMCIPSEINAQVKQAYSKVMRWKREVLRK
jgi:hypothetical protein